MVDAFEKQRSTLLIAPTGGGKTMAGFMVSLIDIEKTAATGLHTLYISPLKALTNDIERNLLQPVADMGIAVSIETRTGDTPSHKRARQRKKPPNILLTTPESLMLMLSYHDAPSIFGKLRLVIIDEVHSIAPTKRGDFTALALARLAALAPQHIRFGLSATVAEPDILAAWLGRTGEPAQTLLVKQQAPPEVKLLKTRGRLPYGGFMARYAVADIYAALLQSKTSLIFVNTRAQAELMFQMLWDVNDKNLPIAIYHGSLTKEQRRKTEAMMAAGRLRAVVATSALELGIDWGDVDLVLHVGAPKGVSRLLQRIGRSNHRMDEPSKAMLVPANHFEVLECLAAIHAIDANRLDGEPMLPGSADVIVQYIINCACSAPVVETALYDEILNAPPYQGVTPELFGKLFQFAVNGGYVLKHYERYARLVPAEDGHGWQIASRMMAMRHRQNIGVIIEAARLRVLRLNPKRGGRVLGDIEESFAQGLVPGDTFFFAGEVLAYVRIRDMVLEARPAKASEPKIPSYAGGNMPLSTFLADGVRSLLNDRTTWNALPPSVCEWLELQKGFSHLPGRERLLVEHFPYHKRLITLIYTFEGRKANQTLGMLMTRRMERMGLKPLSFSVTDYALSIVGLEAIDEQQCRQLLDPIIVFEELEEWLVESPMLKRSFRRVATITGLTEQRHAGARKTMKQVTFSTDLIYDVLRRYEPDHILLHITRSDAERELLDVHRLTDFLLRYRDKADHVILERPSPMAIPILFDVRREPVKGAALEHLLEQAQQQEQAEDLMEDVRHALTH
jgi:ATP-dependent Lhr-like helicase